MKIPNFILRTVVLPFDRYHGTSERRRRVQADSCVVAGTMVAVKRKFLRVARMKDEDHQEEVRNPAAVIAGLKDSPLKADIFTFDQKIPGVVPRFSYHYELESLAVIRIESTRTGGTTRFTTTRAG